MIIYLLSRSSPCSVLVCILHSLFLKMTELSPLSVLTLLSRNPHCNILIFEDEAEFSF